MSNAPIERLTRRQFLYDLLAVGSGMAAGAVGGFKLAQLKEQSQDRLARVRRVQDQIISLQKEYAYDKIATAESLVQSLFPLAKELIGTYYDYGGILPTPDSVTLETFAGREEFITKVLEVRHLKDPNEAGENFRSFTRVLPNGNSTVYLSLEEPPAGVDPFAFYLFLLGHEMVHAYTPIPYSYAVGDIRIIDWGLQKKKIFTAEGKEENSWKLVNEATANILIAAALPQELELTQETMQAATDPEYVTRMDPLMRLFAGAGLTAYQLGSAYFISQPLLFTSRLDNQLRTQGKQVEDLFSVDMINLIEVGDYKEFDQRLGAI